MCNISSKSPIHLVVLVNPVLPSTRTSLDLTRPNHATQQARLEWPRPSSLTCTVARLATRCPPLPYSTLLYSTLSHQVPPSSLLYSTLLYSKPPGATLLQFRAHVFYGISGPAAERISATALLFFLLFFHVGRRGMPVRRRGVFSPFFLFSRWSFWHVLKLISCNRVRPPASRLRLPHFPLPQTRWLAPLYFHMTGPPYCDAQLGHHPGGNRRNVNVSARMVVNRSPVY